MNDPVTIERDDLRVIAASARRMIEAVSKLNVQRQSALLHDIGVEGATILKLTERHLAGRIRLVPRGGI